MRTRSLTALAAFGFGFGLVFAAPVFAADSLPVFDNEVPSLEVLRSILIPEVSGHSQSRTIVLPGHEAPAASTTPVQTVSAPATNPEHVLKLPESMTEKAPEAQPAPVQAETAAPAQADVQTPPMVEAQPAPTPAPEAHQDAGVHPLAVGFRINFTFNSDAVPVRYRAQLDRMVELLKDEPTLKLTIEGHTDAAGSDDYNRDLSQRRAEAVKEYMVSSGIASERLTAIGKGESEPLLRDGYDPRNRRVQFVREDAAERT